MTNSTLIKKPKQCDRVLKTLEDRFPDWVGGVEFVHMFPAILQYHTRIFELEEKGYEIEGRWKEGCNYKEYRLKPKDRLF